MNNFKVNIDTTSVISQKEENDNNVVARTVFNEKNYLAARLLPSETKKDMVIRLLPFSQDGGTPFHKVFMHQVRVDKAVSPNGWKRLPCPHKNEINGESHPCPFCETAEKADMLRRNATNEVDKKRLGDLAYANAARGMWVVRCIDRKHEEDGVKFWVFADSRKKDGVYDKIMSIFNTRLAKGKNIFDLNNGKDLNLTLTKDTMGRTSITITDDDELSPLTTDFEQGIKWIQDPKKWDDLYVVKPYDYMAILVEGGVPRYDKDLKKWIDKKESLEAASDEIDKNLQTSPIVQAEPTQEPSAMPMQSVVDDDEDLPF